MAATTVSPGIQRLTQLAAGNYRVGHHVQLLFILLAALGLHASWQYATRGIVPGSLDRHWVPSRTKSQPSTV